MTTYTRPRILRAHQVRPGDEVAFAADSTGRLHALSTLDGIGDMPVHWHEVVDSRVGYGVRAWLLAFEEHSAEVDRSDLIVVREATS